MRLSRRLLLLALPAALLGGGTALAQTEPDGPTPVSGTINEPAPRNATPARQAGLRVPAGFEVSVAARGLGNARMLAVGPRGRVYLTRRRQEDILLLRDVDGDGTIDARRTVARGLPYVHGIALRGRFLYFVTDTRLYRARIRADGSLGERDLLTADLPDAGQHPNRTLGFGPDGALYITVGSTCNACPDTDPQAATILRARPDGTRRRVFARGLRNTIGFAWHPATSELWGMDHGSDWRGDDQPPEELNQIERGENYGWPFCFADRRPDNYFTAEPEGTTQRAYCLRTRAPALTYTAHSAPIGFAFYTARQFPAAYRGDAFVAMRGSWNRGTPSGYEVVRVRYDGGRPAGFEDFLTGFLIEDGRAQLGRLAGVAVDRDGSLLVSEDDNGVLYRVSRAG